MSLADEETLSALKQQLRISSDSNPSFRLPTSSSSLTIQGKPTQVILTTFSNRSLVILTQTGKPGPLIQVERKGSVVEVRVLLGQDSEELQLIGRALGEELSVLSEKPGIFAIGLIRPITKEGISELIAGLKPILKQ